MYKLKFTKNAVKSIKKIDVQAQKRIKQKLKWFISQKNPLEFAEFLTNIRLGDFRFRIGDYRVVFELLGDTLYVHKIEHRKDIYR
jgi:mRNA interferase RelE/StbE